jgi:hypothetical protein
MWYGCGNINAPTRSSRRKPKAITLQQPIGLDLRPRSALETLGFGFLVHETLIYCLKTQVREDDPVWTCLRSTGIEHVIHLSSVPAEIALDELPLAKPSAK